MGLPLNNQAVLKKTPPPKDPKQLTPDQQLLAANFEKALGQPGAPTPGAIAAQCGISEQAVSNWKRTGKISKHNLAIVADMTGWSVVRLLTGVEPNEPRQPPENFEYRREVNQSEWDLLQDIKMLPQAEREELRADVRRRAGKYQVFTEEILERIAKGKP